jgi:HD-GYP domain-containing protein (c-di-GMP phosphodiesterase class II)
MKKLSINDLKPGMKLAQPVYAKNTNIILLEQETVLNEEFITQLEKWGIDEVYVETDKAKSILKTILSFSSYDEDTIEKKIEEISPPLSLYEPLWKPQTPNITLELLKNHEELIKKIENIFGEIKRTGKIYINEIKNISSLLVDEISSYKELVMPLTKLSHEKNYLYSHAINVASLSIIIGLSLGYNKEQLAELSIGAILHDIGMLKVPKEIWNKPAKISTEEHFEIQKHILKGIDIIINSKGITPPILYITYQHHERVSGIGYPKGLKKENIHEYARIVGLMDAYEALTTKRVYKEVLLPYEALREIIIKSGKFYDSNLVRTFIESVSIYPIGSLVLLNNNEIGIVVNSNIEKILRPIVKILFNSKGERLKESKVVDLAKENNLIIMQALDPEKWEIDIIKEI